MSVTLIEIITVAVLLSVAFILRWQRHIIMRWICPSEIFFLESVEERNRVCDCGYIAFLKDWHTWITLVSYVLVIAVPCVLAFAGLMTLAETPVGQWSAAGLKLAAILCALIPALCVIPLMFARYRKWMRVFLRDYFNDRGIPICEKCGYDLRGQVHPRCSECGRESSRIEQVDELP